MSKANICLTMNQTIKNQAKNCNFSLCFNGLFLNGEMWKIIVCPICSISGTVATPVSQSNVIATPKNIARESIFTSCLGQGSKTHMYSGDQIVLYPCVFRIVGIDLMPLNVWSLMFLIRILCYEVHLKACLEIFDLTGIRWGIIYFGLYCVGAVWNWKL